MHVHAAVAGWAEAELATDPEDVVQNFAPLLAVQRAGDDFANSRALFPVWGAHGHQMTVGVVEAFQRGVLWRGLDAALEQVGGNGLVYRTHRRVRPHAVDDARTMDIADHAVAFAGKRHQSPNLRYVAGNAESIPFEDDRFDVVINVESSHAYGSVANFFAEVKRVLKPGGYFLITDMRDPKNITPFEQTLLGSGLSLVSQKVISPNVVKAIELEDDLKRARIRRQIPARYVKFFEEFGGVKGSQIDKDLRGGSLVYFWYVLRK